MSSQHAFASRLCDTLGKSLTDVSPIQGYGLAPLVSLDQSIVPLKSAVHELEQIMYIVESNCKKTIDHLSLDELRSIRLYTQGWDPEENSFYQILNSTLRSEDSKKLRPWFMYLRLVITALSKIPSERQTIYRGVKAHLVEEYNKEKIFFWWAFTSCTTSLDVLQSEVFLGESEKRTIFAINSFTGKNISKYSTIKTENEVLLLPGCQFKVTSILKQGADLNLIQLEEIEPHYTLVAMLNQNGNLLTPITPKKTSRSASYKNPELEQKIEDEPDELNLAGEQLNDQDLFIISEKAIIDKQLKSLNLACTGITAYNISVLSDAISNNQSLKEINFSQNNISDASVQCLALVINKSALQRIDLSENEIFDQGVTYLAEMLKTNTKLIHLSLNSNRITNSAVKTLANVLIHQNTTLQILNLKGNSNINDDSIDTLIDIIQQSQVLKKLDLRLCRFSNDGERRLQAVAETKNFQLWLSKTF